MATTKKTTEKKFPYTTTVGKATYRVTGVCEVELPEGSRIALNEHGTKSRYAAMHRLGAPRCDECKTANTQADLEYRRKTGRSGSPKAKVTDLAAKQKAKATAAKKAAPAKRAPAKKAAATG